MTTALLDRLIHHCHIVETGNESYRFGSIFNRHGHLVSFGGLAQAQALNTRETLALSGATVSLPQAVEISEKQALGKSVGAEFDIEKGRAVWEVKILNAAGLQDFKVDAITGQVIKIEEEHLRGRLTNFVTGMNLKDLETAMTTLAQAVAMAESQSRSEWSMNAVAFSLKYSCVWAIV